LPVKPKTLYFVGQILYAMQQQPDFKEIAAQLRQPSGAMGIATAERMQVNNQHMIEQTIRVLKAAKGHNVLEIGPGGAYHLPFLLAQAPGINSYTGIDISSTMVDLARQTNAGILSDTIQFVLAPADQGFVSIPASEHYHKIFTVNTLYFWDKPLQQAGELYRALARGGQLVLSFASAAFMRSLPFTTYGFNLYTTEQAASLLEEASFHIEDIHTETEKVPGMPEEAMLRTFHIIIAGKK
jgi:SAM-dependent methyltransferase